MPRPLVTGSAQDIDEVRALGAHKDSRKAAWTARGNGSGDARQPVAEPPHRGGVPVGGA